MARRTFIDTVNAARLLPEVEGLDLGGSGMPEGGRPGEVLTTGADGTAEWQAPADVADSPVAQTAQTALDTSTAASELAEAAYAAAARSQESVHSVLPMLSGSVTTTPEDGALPVDLGQAVNSVTGLDGVGGPVDVIFPSVTTPDGRVDPDGLGTLLHVDRGADRLTWPGGTIVHGAPPEGQAAMASLVRVGGAVTVVWPPDVVTGEGPGATAQVAKIEQIISGEVEVQPGGIVMKEAKPKSAAFGGGPAVFMNPHSVPTSDELVLTVGTVQQTLEIIGDEGRLSVDTTTRPDGLRDYSLEATVTLDPSGELVQNWDGWLVAVAPGPAYADARVWDALGAIELRLPFSRVVTFADGTWGVVLLYVEEDPNWRVMPWEDAVYLHYSVEGQPWGYRGMTSTSALGLPMVVRTSSYESLGITLPGTFHRKAELEAMGVYLGG